MLNYCSRFILNVEWSCNSLMTWRGIGYHGPRKLLATVWRSGSSEIMPWSIQVCIYVSRSFLLPSLFHLMSRGYFKHLYSFFCRLLTFWNVRFVIIYESFHLRWNLRILDSNCNRVDCFLDLCFLVTCFEITGLSHFIFEVWRWFCIEFLNLWIYNI